MSAPVKDGEVDAGRIKPRYDLDEIGFGGMVKHSDLMGASGFIMGYAESESRLSVTLCKPINVRVNGVYHDFKVKTDRKGQTIVVLDKAPPKGTTVTVEVRRGS